LVLAQNNHELRATGGFISGVGELRVEGGRLAALEFSDSFAVDNLEVPHELTPRDFQQVLGGELWFFRDANWDPDFPTSAQRALDIYAHDRGIRADGVIALDLTALQILLNAIGPLQVQGIHEPVSGKNVLEIMQAEWGDSSGGGSDLVWWEQRKDFLGPVAAAALDEVLSGGGVEPGVLVAAIKQALDEKHLLIYLADPQASGLLRQLNWDGALPNASPPSHFLMVVDTNVGFNKVDAKVVRSIHYQVDLSLESGPEARLTTRYRNRSVRPVESCIQEARYGDTYADMMDRCYWAYVRVYTPPGSLMLERSNLPLPDGSLTERSSGTELQWPISSTLASGSWTAWTAFFSLEPGAERTVVYRYQLPSWVLERTPDGSMRHRLWVQKQPGTGAVPLRVDFILPPGAELVSTSPGSTLSFQDGVLSSSTDLRADREFDVTYREQERGP
jgi:hypothetical protein